MNKSTKHTHQLQLFSVCFHILLPLISLSLLWSSRCIFLYNLSYLLRSIIIIITAPSVTVLIQCKRPGPVYCNKIEIDRWCSAFFLFVFKEVTNLMFTLKEKTFFFFKNLIFILGSFVVEMQPDHNTGVHKIWCLTKFPSSFAACRIIGSRDS